MFYGDEETFTDLWLDFMIEVCDAMNRSWFFKPLGAIVDVVVLWMMAMSGVVFH